MSELRGLGAVNDELKKLGGTVAAVSVDAAEDSRRVVERNKLPFPILCDTSGAIIRAYGLVHKDGGPTGDVAIPAHVLIERSGRIVWRWASHRVQDRPDPQVVIDRIHSLLSD